MILEDIQTYLDDNGIGTAGTDIFIGNLPDDLADAIMIVPGSAGEQDKYIDIRTLVVDFWSRNSSYRDGYDKLMEVWDLLHQATHYSLTDFYVFFSQALGNIEDLDRDQKGRQLQKLSVKIIYKEINPIS